MTRRRVVAGLGMLLLPGPPASAAESTGAGKSLMLHAAGHARRLEAGSRQITAPGLATEGGEGVPVFNAGDRVEVHFRNGLTKPAVLTFRGLDGNAAAEPLTGRAPVAPGDTDTFTVRLDRPGTVICEAGLLDDGTGARAGCPLIVREQTPPRVDRDEVVLIEDWRPSADGNVASGEPGADDAEPLYTLNGRARPTLAARPNERIRFRFINGCQRNAIALEIPNHDIRIMAIDSCPAEPFLARGGRIVLAPGTRIDAFVDGDAAAGASSSIMLDDGRGPRRIGLFAVTGEPVRRQPPGPPEALKPIGLPDAIDLRTAVRVDMDLTFAAPAPDRPGPRFTWTRPGEFSRDQAPAFRVLRNRAAVITLANRGSVPVTFALHGHHVRLLDRLDDGWKPFWLDTLMVGPRQTHRIAFLAEHSGSWLMEAIGADRPTGRRVSSYHVT